MINYIRGDLFSHRSAKTSVLVHACNCKGSWGAGVARVFARQFPSTYEKHQQYCSQFARLTDLLGTSQIIESSPSDPGHQQAGKAVIVCLFTSDGFGAHKCLPQEIVHYTRLALLDMAGKLPALGLETHAGSTVVNMPKINAGLFAVPWKDTEAVLAQTGLYINVYVVD